MQAIDGKRIGRRACVVYENTVEFICMPPRYHQDPIYHGTVLDSFRHGAAIAAADGLHSETQTFGLGFALIPGLTDEMGNPTGWLTKRFGSIPEGAYWLRDLDIHGDHVYAAIFTRINPEIPRPQYEEIPQRSATPLAESFGHGNIDLVSSWVSRIPARWGWGEYHYHDHPPIDPGPTR